MWIFFLKDCPLLGHMIGEGVYFVSISQLTEAVCFQLNWIPPQIGMKAVIRRQRKTTLLGMCCEEHISSL